MIKNFLHKQLNVYFVFTLIFLFCGYSLCSSMLDMESRLNYIDHNINVLDTCSENHKNIFELISQYAREKDISSKDINIQLQKNSYLDDIEKLKEEKTRLQILSKRFEELKDMKQKHNSKVSDDAKDKSADSKRDWFKKQKEFNNINRILFHLGQYGKYVVNSPISDQTYTQKLNFHEPSFIIPVELSKYCSMHSSYIKNVNGRIIQLKVVNQTSENGGGGASCGYQALLNSFIIARLILSSGSQRALILHELTDKNLRMDLFGSESSLWRSAIINSRKINVLKKFFFNFLLSSLCDNENIKNRIINKEIVEEKSKTHDIRSLLRYIDDDENCEFVYFNKMGSKGDENERKFFMDNSILKLLSHKIVKHLLQQNGNKIVINQALLVNIFLSNLNSHDNFSKIFNKLDDAEKQSKIKKYLPGLDCSIEYSHQAIIDKKSGQSMLPYEWPMLLAGKKWSQPGEWLCGKEIFEIIEIEKTQGNMFKSIFDYLNKVLFDNLTHDVVELIYRYIETDLYLNSYFVRYGDVRLNEVEIAQIKSGKAPDPYSSQKDFNELTQFVRDPDSYGFRIMTIIVGGNHWISCVINKRRRLAREHLGDDIQYIIADSVDHDYTQSNYIHELLERLEGRKIPEFAKDINNANGANWCVIA